MDREKYIKEIKKELKKYGYDIIDGALVVRDVRESQRRLASIVNCRYRNLEYKVKHYFANDLDEIDPLNIKPTLELLPLNKDDKYSRERKDIFNYAKSFWGIPTSNGYGRRLNYILWDDNTGKVIGIFGLCDPVIGLGVRDNFIGWDRKSKEERLYNMMTAYILGAVPPYNKILGSKLVALAAISYEVQRDFYFRYKGRKTNIKKENKPPYLIAIDTMGAFGKSAIYNRLRGWKFIGYTKGESHIHLTLNGVYSILIEVIEKYGNKDILKKYKYGEGPNYKLRIVSEGLRILGLKRDKFVNHSVKRGYYIAPLAENWREFFLKQTDEPIFNTLSLEENFEYWKERWLTKKLGAMR